MKYTIDRLEEQIAVLQNESGESFAVPAALFAPLDIREGDIITIILDSRQTEARKEEVHSKLHQLFARSKEQQKSNDTM
jgi:hypothetical protein